MQTEAKMRTLFCVVAFAWLTLNLPAVADPNPHAGDHPNPHAFHGAPGPVIGAGLPLLAIGYGVYWFVKRRRKAK
jgi:hypothetical protein